MTPTEVHFSDSTFFNIPYPESLKNGEGKGTVYKFYKRDVLRVNLENRNKWKI